MLRTERTSVGLTPAGREIESFLLSCEDLTIEVWTYGATLVEVRTPGRDGHVANVCARLPDLASYVDRTRNPYVGATMGRFCRCVAGGEFELDGEIHTLDRNDGRHHLHGGTAGFDTRTWTAEAFQDAGAAEVRLSLTSEDGDQGYPGELTVRTSYRVEPGGVLVIDHEATTTKPTVVGLTNHAFWNLSGNGTVDGHRLRLNTAEAVRFDSDLVPLPGPPADLSGTPLDFRSERLLGDTRIDNCFLLHDDSWAAELRHPGSGRTMRVTTDQPGVGVYTGDWFSERPRCGICLETGPLPDAPNRPDYPSARLDPEQVYRHRTTHVFATTDQTG
ncbi:aldose epimerase family protein [Lentzea sp.]|uniref:aldose epimerase family protein n=1 Tax=Lentzea sp. TaxID=56099 RepID=UPI002BCBF3B2|nr:aldose epimerase family protein [Lentzea sp.]HUQ54083.1 aldose epimerase family protein [Lentzea sp.]